MNNERKPSIEELEALLERDDLEIEIMPDGSIRGVTEGTAKNAKPIVLTAKYAAAEFY